MSWEHHVDVLISKLAPKLQVLRRLKRFLSQNDLIIMYKTLVQPCIDYCITVWGYCCEKYIYKVQRMMNSAARIISGNYDWDIKGVDILKQLDLMNFKQRRDYFMGLLTYKSLNGYCPD